MTRSSLRRLQELARVNWRVRLINRKFPTVRMVWAVVLDGLVCDPSRS